MLRFPRPHTLLLVAGALVLTTSIVGCQALRQFAALRSVDFMLDRVADVTLAGVQVDHVRSYNDLRATDIARIAASVSQGRLPTEFDLHIMAENPAENSVDARLLQMDWTLFLEGRETVSGILERDILLPAGAQTDIPLNIQLDLVRFFGDNLRDLVNLALSLSGQGGEPMSVRIEAMPTIQTPIGPIQYPQPITIVSREVG